MVKGGGVFWVEKKTGTRTNKVPLTTRRNHSDSERRRQGEGEKAGRGIGFVFPDWKRATGGGGGLPNRRGRRGVPYGKENG